MATGGIAILGDSLKDFCMPPCLVGTWKVTNETVSKISASGGAGAIWTLGRLGILTIDHFSSAPLTGPYGLSITYSGEETERVTLPSDPAATSGTWTATVLSGDVTSKTTVFGETRSGPLGQAPGYSASGLWTCNGNTMTTSYSGVGETVTLTRLSH
jgi:hypothetical protein